MEINKYYKAIRTRINSGGATGPLEYTGENLTCAIEDATHFVVITGGCGRDSQGRRMLTTFCKEADFFKEQGGLEQKWGFDWLPFKAESNVEARRAACKMYGGVPSAIITGEW